MSTEDPRTARWRRRARRLTIGLGLAATAGGAALLLLELGVRLSGVQPDFFFQLDPEVGAIHIPGKRGWHTFAEGRQRIEINRHGYRDREWRVDKPVDVRRIAVLGDSFVEGFQVPIDAHVLRRLEERLGDPCGDGKRLELMNFGVSGFGTGQALETLRHRAAAFDLDAVLLFAYPSNDLFDNSREIDIEPNRLHFALGADGALHRLPYRVADHPVKRWLRHHSQAYLFVRDRLKRFGAIRRAMIAARWMQEEKTRAERDAARRDASSLLDARYQVPPPPPIERAWVLTEALVVAVRDSAEAQGAAFGVAHRDDERFGEHPRPLDRRRRRHLITGVEQTARVAPRC
ncbi:MAG: SGNH/GDSL hydrolase family protein, partial [Acidobacteriota bacterium]